MGEDGRLSLWTAAGELLAAADGTVTSLSWHPDGTERVMPFFDNPAIDTGSGALHRIQIKAEAYRL